MVSCVTGVVDDDFELDTLPVPATLTVALPVLEPVAVDVETTVVVVTAVEVVVTVSALPAAADETIAARRPA